MPLAQVTCQIGIVELTPLGVHFIFKTGISRTDQLSPHSNLTRLPTPICSQSSQSSQLARKTWWVRNMLIIVKYLPSNLLCLQTNMHVDGLCHHCYAVCSNGLSKKQVAVCWYSSTREWSTHLKEMQNASLEMKSALSSLASSMTMTVIVNDHWSLPGRDPLKKFYSDASTVPDNI